MQGNYSDLLVVLSGVYSQLRGDEKAAEAEKEESSQVHTQTQAAACAHPCLLLDLIRAFRLGGSGDRKHKQPQQPHHSTSWHFVGPTCGGLTAAWSGGSTLSD